MKLAILGAGAMGSQLYTAAASSGEVLLIDKNPEKIKHAKWSSCDMEDLRLCDAVLLAVKPHAFSPFELKDKLILSVMAGVSIERLQEFTGSRRIIRAMPNLAVSKGIGATGWMASEKVIESDKAFAQNLFEGMGYAVELKSEEMIDAFAAVAGSGPAYFFYLTEVMEEQAIEFGFDPDVARKLAVITCQGAASLLESSDPLSWRKAVSSKGGMTEAAVNTFKEKGFSEAVKAGMQRGKNRAKELVQ